MWNSQRRSDKVELTQQLKVVQVAIVVYLNKNLVDERKKVKGLSLARVDEGKI